MTLKTPAQIVDEELRENAEGLMAALDVLAPAVALKITRAMESCAERAAQSYDVPEPLAGVIKASPGGVFRNELGEYMVEPALTEHGEIILVRTDGTTTNLKGEVGDGVGGMTFSSGKHEKLTADPKAHSPVNWFTPLKFPSCSCGYDPRNNRTLVAHWASVGLQWVGVGGRVEAEVSDRPLTNPANPILLEFRNSYPGIAPTTPERMARYLRYIGDPLASSEDDPSWTSEQRDHARKVLTRLAALS